MAEKTEIITVIDGNPEDDYRDPPYGIEYNPYTGFVTVYRGHYVDGEPVYGHPSVSWPLNVLTNIVVGALFWAGALNVAKGLINKGGN